MVETGLIIDRLPTRLFVPLYNRTLTRVHHTVDIAHHTVPVLVKTVFLKMGFRVETCTCSEKKIKFSSKKVHFVGLHYMFILHCAVQNT